MAQVGSETDSLEETLGVTFPLKAPVSPTEPEPIPEKSEPGAGPLPEAGAIANLISGPHPEGN